MFFYNKDEKLHFGTPEFLGSMSILQLVHEHQVVLPNISQNLYCNFFSVGSHNKP